MSESRKRLSLGSKKPKKTSKKSVQESVSPDLMMETLLEESEKKVAEIKVIAELNAIKEEEVKTEPTQEIEQPAEKEDESKPARPRLDLGKTKKCKVKKEEKEEVKEAKVEEPKEKLVTDRDMFSIPEDEKKAAAERLKKKTAEKRAAKKKEKEEVKEEVIQTPEDRIMSALDGQLSAMGRRSAADAPETKSLSEQKIENLEGQVRDMRRMMLEMSGIQNSNTIVRGLGFQSPGSGEVNLLKLDDVKEGSFDKTSDGQLILWSDEDQKFVSSSERGVDNFFSEGIGGYEFTGGFSDRAVGQTGASDFGTFVPYTQAMADAGQWRRFGFSESQQQANDNAYFPTDARPNRVFDQSKGLFGGMFMPSGVTELIDYGWQDVTGGTFSAGHPQAGQSYVGYSTEVNSGSPSDFNYTAADGSFDFRECQPGDLLQLRFDFNVNVQIANTTLEIALIWQTRDTNDEPTFTFALTGQPIFYGTGTVGRTFLNRPFLSAYFASAEDTNARALLAIRADNPIQVAPLSTLVTIQR